MSPVQRVAAMAAAVLLALPALAGAAPTDLDSTFGTSGVTTTAFAESAYANDVVAAADGKLVVVGAVNSVDGFDWGLARYSADGVLDTSFGAGGKVVTPSTGASGGTAAATNGAGGVFFTGEIEGSNAQAIVDHVDAAGQATAFSAVLPIAGSTRTAGRALALLPDGRVLLAGDATIGGIEKGFVARFEANGDPDATFGGTGLVMLPDAHCSPCSIAALALDGTGNAYVAGAQLGSPSSGRVLKLDTAGTVASYGEPLQQAARLDALTEVHDLVLEGEVPVILGSAGSECAITRLTGSGALDAGFGTNGTGTIAVGSFCDAVDMAVDAQGRFTFAGSSDDGTDYQGVVGRFTATGHPDSTFVVGGAAHASPGGAPSSLHGIALQGTKVVVAGLTGSPSHEVALARYAGGVILVGGNNGSGSGSGGSGSTTPPATTAPPSAPSSPAPPADTTAPRIIISYPHSQARTTDSRPTFSGRASSDEGDTDKPVLELREVRSGNRLGPVRRVTGSRSETYWTARAPRLADGRWQARARHSDAAGNAGESPTVTFTVGKLPAPSNSGDFSVVGNAEVGEILGVRASQSWSPATDLEVRYRWQRCQGGDCRWASPTRDADAYRVQSADRGHRLKAVVYASNPDRDAPERESSLSREVPPPDQIPYIADRRYPRVLGDDISVGDIVHAYEGDWRGTPASIRFSYRWQLCRWEVWCEDIGTGPTYRVRTGDQGHKLNLIVYASNRAGSNYAWSGTGRAIQGDRKARRRAIVTDSYLRVFGRDPRPDELTYWVNHRTEELPALIANHRQYTRDNRWMAEEVVRRAYEKVYGHGPYASDTEYTANQTAQFTNDVNSVWRAGTTYDDLVTQLARDLANQAIERIFFWRNQLGNRKLVEAHIRSKDVSMFVDRMRRDVYDQGGATRGENLWTDVALSNEPLHGAARTSYPGAGSKGAADRENCYGAVGPGCTGVMGGAASRSTVTDGFTTLDGRKMAYLQVTTAVGSIAHDAMCRVYPWTSYLKGDNGVWCGDAPADPTEALPLFKIYFTGAAEWNKATANTLQGRKWDAMYGPYPAPDARHAKDSKHARTYSDDLRPAVRQERWMELTRGGWILGIADLDKPFAWQGKEVRGSLRLEAPAGTVLDSSDKDFCSSQRFKYVNPGWIAGQRAYNVCS